MAKLEPFKAYLYNKNKVNIDEVVIPPYDIITPLKQDNYYKKSPFNFIRLDLTKEKEGDEKTGDKYFRASETFKEWISDEILKKDDKKGFYIYRQIFDTKRFGEKIRTGFITTVKLEEFGSKIILPHEKTLSKPKKDRLNLMKATNANLSQIFGLYMDPGKRIDEILDENTKQPPYFDFKDDENVRHLFWKVHNDNNIEEIIRIMKDKIILIADGHHRYETALNYQKVMLEQNPDSKGEQSWNYVMMALVNIESGIYIRPIHRILKNYQNLNEEKFLEELKEYFILEVLDGNDKLTHQNLLSKMELNKEKHVYGMYLPSKNYYLLSLRDSVNPSDLVFEDHSAEWKELDVAILQYIILNNILGVSPYNFEDYLGFPQDDEEAVTCVNLGGCQAAFLLNPVDVKQIISISKKNERMPQKTSFFFPKIWSGFAIHKFD